MSSVRARWLTVFLDFPAATHQAGVAFWREVTGSELSAFRGEHGQFATLIPPGGDPWLRVQRVASGPGGCHLDLHIEGPLEEAADAAVRLGATVRHREEGLIIAASPGGFPFCLVGWQGEARQPEPAVAGGAASLVDQLCLDAPPGAYEREARFWGALLGLAPRLGIGGRPEFCYVGQGDGGVRLLVQRRQRAGQAERVAGHVDVACGDLGVVTAAHVAAGARVVLQEDWWTVLADPAGRQYCLVAREPGQPPRP
jgi:hypothetical protein